MTPIKKVLITTVKFVVFGGCLGILTLGSGSSNRPPEKSADKETHRISLREARTLIENFRRNSPSEAVVGGFFVSDAIQALISQPGVVGIRAYFARKDDGSLTVILVGVDEKGRDIVEGEGPMDRWFPCPPFCPTNSELLQGHYAFKAE